VTEATWQALAKQLAEAIAATGELTDSTWRRAFDETPRHVFVPRYWALDEYNRPMQLIDGANLISGNGGLTAFTPTRSSSRSGSHRTM
jgi:protein-L-isoaspartate O-methyltransferase